jgi:3-hydroxybutyryl-CoA dehydrogenase
MVSYESNFRLLAGNIPTMTALSNDTVGIVGSGIMGAGLAEVAARAGYTVIVRSRSEATARQMIDTLDRGLARHVAKGRMTDDERVTIVGRVTPTADIAALSGCGLIIESVVEDLAVKKSLFAELDAVADSDAILATNTSTLPVVEMAMATTRPERVCGIHFFNPAPAMQLVEIIRPLTATDDTIATAKAFVASCGKDAVEVVDRAGFIVNALLFPYLNNAIRMWEHGTASMEDIDTAMKGGCNFPMGPFALLDLVGLDTSLSILDALYAEFGDPNYAAMPTLRRKVAAGQLGRKAKHGFYTY